MNAKQPRAAISVENIVKRYGDFEAVAGITFDVADGEILDCSDRTGQARARSSA